MTVILNCAICGTPIRICASHAPRRVTCSKPCRVKWMQRFHVEPHELLIAVWEESVTSIAKSFGVSDKAIEKRCKKFGLVKPPRGYWAKIQTGIPHDNALLALGWKKEEIEKLALSLSAAGDQAHEKISAIN